MSSTITSKTDISKQLPLGLDTEAGPELRLCQSQSEFHILVCLLPRYLQTTVPYPSRSTSPGRASFHLSNLLRTDFHLLQLNTGTDHEIRTISLRGYK